MSSNERQFSNVELQLEEDVEAEVEVGRKRLRRRSSNRNREVREDHDTDVSVMEIAKRVQSELNPEFPSFIKLITKGRTQRIPKDFLEKHMPKHDAEIVLVGENGEERKVKFLINGFLLCGGWTEFFYAQKLKERDVAVFCLVDQWKFKVYIVRRNDVGDVDAGLALLDLTQNVNESDLDDRSLIVSKKCKKLHIHREEDNEFQGETSREGDFVDYVSFSIAVDALSLDAALEGLCGKYYELCFSQKTYLHEQVIKKHNPRLAAHIIYETVAIADAIQGSELFTSPDDFANWDDTLKAFKLLRMDVDFLCTRLNKLRELAFQCRDTDFKRCNEAKLVLTQLEKDMETIEEIVNRFKEAKNVLREEDVMTFNTPLNRLKDAKNVLQSEIDTLNASILSSELTFKEIAAAPW